MADDVVRLSEGKAKMGYLYNDMEEDELPAPEVYTSKGDYVGVDIRYLCKEVVDNIHAVGKKCVVYFTYLPEDIKYVDFMIHLGVDKVTSEIPLQWKTRVEELLEAHRQKAVETPPQVGVPITA